MSVCYTYSPFLIVGHELDLNASAVKGLIYSEHSPFFTTRGISELNRECETRVYVSMKLLSDEADRSLHSSLACKSDCQTLPDNRP